jgi:hypothetical protein
MKHQREGPRSGKDSGPKQGKNGTTNLLPPPNTARKTFPGAPYSPQHTPKTVTARRQHHLPARLLPCVLSPATVTGITSAHDGPTCPR